MGVLTDVQTVIYPDDTSSKENFDEAIQIRWPEVKGLSFHLCVGTEPGNWDILSGNVGKRRQQLFDLTDLPAKVQIVYAQLITLGNDDGGDGVVGPVIEIHRI